MSAELVTPVDEATGIPLPILPQEHLRYDDPNVNWHHAWHADSAPELQGLGGRALRHSRVQLVRDVDHNYKDNGRPNYHNFFVGPELPQSDGEKFKLCIIAAAGYIPEKAIDLRSGEPVEVVMNDEEMALLRTKACLKPVKAEELQRVRQRVARSYRSSRQSGVQRKRVNHAVAQFQANRQTQAEYGLHHLVYQYEPMRDFFRQHILVEELDGIRESEVEEFLKTPDPDRKQDLGRRLLRLAINQQVDKVEDAYQVLRRQGRLHPKMPQKAKSLVYYKLGNQEDRFKVAQEQARLLGSRLGIAS